MADQPDRGGRGLVKEQEDAAKKAFDRTALAKFLFRPGGRQAEAVLLPFGIPGNDGGGVQGGVDPGDEPQSPIGGVQADNARANGIEAHSPFQQRTSERSIMDVGGRKQKEEGQAGAATEQGMHAIAT